ncbi:MAG: hypothetical protein IPH08_04445 [Rhodocyclaceae bacterium]|nr:hypothetical protein [Rhodocyclaceae bacterium]
MYPDDLQAYRVTLDSLEASLPALEASGWDHAAVYQIGCPYISAARSMMLRKALDAKATVVVFIDHDLSWDSGDLLRLIETKGDGRGDVPIQRANRRIHGAIFPGIDGTPIVREDGCIRAHSIPAGFLKITRAGVNTFIMNYPELTYGEKCAPMVDLFNHGVMDHTWYGEDYAFAKRWREKCGDIWLIPDRNINHHLPTEEFKGNFHRYLLKQPGGSGMFDVLEKTGH